MKFEKYVGSYRLPSGKQFSCSVVATDFKDAQAKMDAWNVGATLDGYAPGLDPTTVPMPKENGFSHWLTFITWLGMSAGVLYKDCLADDGLIHELQHLHEDVMLVHPEVDYMKEYLNLCQQLNLIAPVSTSTV